MAAGISDQATQLALKPSWSMGCEPVSEFGVWERLRLVAIGVVSGDGRVASRHGRGVDLHVLVLGCRSHDAAIVTPVCRDEKCNV
jgi:hypothetical protein